MSESFLNETVLEELTNLFEKTPLPIIMKAFDQVDETDIAVFLLLLDVAGSTVSAENSDEMIRKTLARTDDDTSEEQPEETLTAYAQQIFAQFPLQKQVRIAEQITITEMVETQRAEQIWEELIGKIKGVFQSTLFFGNGAKNLAKLLAQVDIEQQNQLMGALQRHQPELIGTVADHLFTFEDLEEVPTETIATLLRVLETNTLALALCDAPSAIQERFFENMLDEQAEIVEAEMEKLTFEQKQLTETARQSVVSLIRNFAAKGLLKIN